MKLAVNPLQAIAQTQYRNRLKKQLSDPDRLAAVYGSKFWTAPNHDKLRQFCNTAAMMLNTPVAHITLVTDEVQRVVASNDEFADDTGLEEPLPDFSICQHVVGLDEAVPVGNIPADPMVCHVNISVEGGLHAYLGVPLISDGKILGALCVLDYHERDWTDIDVATLSQLSLALVNMHEIGRL